jgi:hypothetical protein
MKPDVVRRAMIVAGKVAIDTPRVTVAAQFVA